MKSIKQEGKTVEEAIKKALSRLGLTREQADVNIVDEGNKGIFGLIGSKNAVVEVKEKEDPVKLGKDFLEELFTTTTLQVEVEVIDEETDNEQVLFNLKSPDLGIIIGHRGETLDALQYLTSLVVNREVDQYYRVLLDAEGYRGKRKQTLIRLAKKLTRKALTTGRKVVLEPMPPHERRIIHMTIKDDSRVISYSEGKEPFRKVMIEAVETSK